MAAEIIAAVSACSTAYNFMKKAVEEGHELADMTRALGKFFDAREEISILEQKATNPSKIQKLFGGASIEAQALEITLQKHKAEMLEKQLKDLFYWSGQAPLWHQMLQERTKLRNMRIAEAKAKAQTKAAMIDIAVVTSILIVGMAVVLSATKLVVG
jgi:enamine deaminase RidA (YjgF/YER057c/UK114 family)